MLSIYVSPFSILEDREFYFSLPEGGLISLLDNKSEGILFEKVRCSYLRDKFYEKYNCLGNPKNAVMLGTDDWRIADFMFCAPKSVSIQGCIGNDYERIIGAHNDSVKECLGILESEYASASHQKQISTKSLLICLILHLENRYGEMEIHSHALVFNETTGRDGNGYALNLEKLLEGKWLGQYYLSQLASKIQELGYPIRETAKGFELEAYSDEQLLKLSARSYKIIENL